MANEFDFSIPFGLGDSSTIENVFVVDATAPASGGDSGGTLLADSISQLLQPESQYLAIFRDLTGSNPRAHDPFFVTDLTTNGVGLLQVQLGTNVPSLTIASGSDGEDKRTTDSEPVPEPTNYPANPPALSEKQRDAVRKIVKEALPNWPKTSTGSMEVRGDDGKVLKPNSGSRPPIGEQIIDPKTGKSRALEPSDIDPVLDREPTIPRNVPVNLNRAAQRNFEFSDSTPLYLAAGDRFDNTPVAPVDKNGNVVTKVGDMVKFDFLNTDYSDKFAPGGNFSISAFGNPLVNQQTPAQTPAPVVANQSTALNGTTTTGIGINTGLGNVTLTQIDPLGRNNAQNTGTLKTRVGGTPVSVSVSNNQAAQGVLAVGGIVGDNRNNIGLTVSPSSGVTTLSGKATGDLPGGVSVAVDVTQTYGNSPNTFNSAIVGGEFALGPFTARGDTSGNIGVNFVDGFPPKAPVPDFGKNVNDAVTDFQGTRPPISIPALTTDNGGAVWNAFLSPSFERPAFTSTAEQANRLNGVFSPPTSSPDTFSLAPSPDFFSEVSFTPPIENFIPTPSSASFSPNFSVDTGLSFDSLKF